MAMEGEVLYPIRVAITSEHDVVTDVVIIKVLKGAISVGHIALARTC